MNSYPAQIVFTESDRGHRWIGRLLRPSAAVDVQRGCRPVHGSPFFLIEQNVATGRCTATMQGSYKSGRRYASYASVTEAQLAGIRWAGRRFRIPVEGGA
jgi:hypothetical protein